MKENLTKKIIRIAVVAALYLGYLLIVSNLELLKY